MKIFKLKNNEKQCFAIELMINMINSYSNTFAYPPEVIFIYI